MAKPLTNDGLKQKIAGAIAAVKRLKTDRQDTNAEIAEVRAKMEALGIPKAAFDMAMKYENMDPDDRIGFDTAYALVREAAGLPIQEDLFAAADRKAADADKEWAAAAPKSPDAGEIDKVIQSQDADKLNGKKVHQPTGEHKGTIN